MGGTSKSKGVYIMWGCQSLKECRMCAEWSIGGGGRRAGEEMGGRGSLIYIQGSFISGPAIH